MSAADEVGESAVSATGARVADDWVADGSVDREESGHVVALGANEAVSTGRTSEVSPPREPDGDNGVRQPGYLDRPYADPAYTGDDAAYGDPAYRDSGYGDAHGDPVQADLAYGEPTYDEPAYDEPAYGEPAHGGPGQTAGRARPAEEIDGAVRVNFAELAQAEIVGGSQPDIAGLDEKTLQPLLLHSLAELREVWLPLLEAAGVRSVAEVGSESGMTTNLLVETLRRGGGGRLLVVDPDPGVVPASGRGLQVEVIRGYSPEALAGHAPTDAYLIDGDHNYHTVSGELNAIQRAVDEFEVSYFPLVVLHDVGWPAGRRDQYYSPDRVPASARQPYSWDAGVTIDQVDAGRGGFRGEGAFAWALSEGGARNGVRTAVEDFVAMDPDLRLFTITPIFGLGVIVDRRAPWARRVASLLEPWVSNGLLARMERNRVDLYLKVLSLQDDLVVSARQRQREWSRLDAERSRVADLELQRLSRIADLERALAAEQHDAERARAALADEPKLVHVARLANAALKERLGRPSPASAARAGTSTAAPASGTASTAAGTVAPALDSLAAAPAKALPFASPRTGRSAHAAPGPRGLLPALRSARRALPRR